MNTHPASPLAAIVLAAGKGTRMKSNLAKVLHPLAGQPMLAHVLAALTPLAPAHTVVVTGHMADDVEAAIKPAFPHATFVRQEQQNGTGHAVQQAEQQQSPLATFTGTVLIVCGDVPLVQTEALAGFLGQHHQQGNAVSVACANVANPTGLGRILRDANGNLLTIREQKDCSADEAAICEVNTGIYAVDATHLFQLLAQVGNTNSQGEYYLTDIVPLGLKAGLKVGALPIAQPAEELAGVNTRVQLAAAEATIQNRLREAHMLAGVSLMDPATTYFSMDTVIGPDTTVGAGVVFGPGVSIAGGVTIHPFCHLSGCTIETGAQVGPFARTRSGTHLGENVELGSFVVTKKASIGKGTKAKQLNCLVDCTIGSGVNIGAGAMIANYHHFRKEKCETVIKDDASIGSTSTLVAPVTVGEKAFVGAGTTLRNDVPDNALAVSKSEFIIKQGYGK